MWMWYDSIYVRWQVWLIMARPVCERNRSSLWTVCSCRSVDWVVFTSSSCGKFRSQTRTVCHGSLSQMSNFLPERDKKKPQKTTWCFQLLCYVAGFMGLLPELSAGQLIFINFLTEITEMVCDIKYKSRGRIRSWISTDLPNSRTSVG